MKKSDKIYVAGHTGMVGLAIIRKLKEDGYNNIITKSHSDLDLRDQRKTREFFEKYKPNYVFLAAAKVGGIHINDIRSGEMIYDNLMIQTNVIDACHKFDVKKLLFLGSSCIYPKYTKQPITEEHLLTGEMEQTNIGYAIAKIAGLTMCKMYRKQYGCNFISAMPCNLYGFGDNFNLKESHVLPAMIRKFHEAKIEGKEFVELWGSGTPKREFLFIDDLAEALIFLMDNYDEFQHLNVGIGEDITIKELAETIKEITGFEGKIIWNTQYPDGTPRKLLDVFEINSLGWKAKTSLKEGIKNTYEWFKENYDVIRK